MAKLSVDMAKFKASDVRGIQVHNQREGKNHKNENIDESKTHLNYDLHNEDKINYTDAVKNRIAEGRTTTKAIRRDATVMCGLAVQVNNEFFEKLTPEQEKEFFKTVYDTIGDKYGKENIISANVHKDEKAPHIQINMVPLTKDGRLTAKEIFDRKGLLNLHTDLAKALQGRSFDIQRGEPEKEKKERVSIHEFKLKDKTQDIELREQQLRFRELELDKKEREAKKLAMTAKQVEELHTRTKVKSGIFTEEHVEMSIADYNKLTQTAIAGAKATIENEQLKPLQDKVKELETDNNYLKTTNANLKENNKDLTATISEQRKTISHIATRNYTRYSAKGLSDKQSALVMTKADKLPASVVATTIASNSGSAPSASNSARDYGKGILADALKMDDTAVALTAKLGDEFDNWDCLTAEARAEKAKAMGLGIE